jgi:hypothetical protein
MQPRLKKAVATKRQVQPARRKPMNRNLFSVRHLRS